MFGVLLALFFVGLAHGNPLSRIINGSPASRADHPHQIALKRWSTNTNSWYHTCGGSIVGENWVVTAAHCVEGSSASNFRVDLNDGRQNDPNNQGFDVLEIVMHPNYNSGSGAYPNDIALLRTEYLDLSAGNEIIPLAESGENFDGANCEISGWGHTVTGTGDKTIPNQLQQTDGTILTQSECNSQWSRNYNHAVHICIHNTSTGTCQGDSGGPLVCPRGNTMVLAGVTSWGVSGCYTSYPSVYARVSNYRSWLDQEMNRA